jgi:hypothetical protein
MKCEVLKVYDDTSYTGDIISAKNKTEGLKIANEILANEKDKLFSLDVYYVKGDEYHKPIAQLYAKREYMEFQLIKEN